jgi:hypothetical protein
MSFDPAFLASQLLFNETLAHNSNGQISMAEQASRQLLADVKR